MKKQSPQSAHDVPGTSSEGPLKVAMSGTYRGPSEDLQRTLRGPTQKLMIQWKNCFLEAIVFVLHIYSCFLQEKQIFKSCKRTSTGRLRDSVTGRLGNQMMGRSGDVRGTSIKHVFLNSTHKHIKLTLTDYAIL